MKTLFIFVLFFICSSFAAKNYYKILGIDKFATERDIKKAFREKAKLYHPDKNNSPNAEQKFRDLVEGETRSAYQTHNLTNPEFQFSQFQVLQSGFIFLKFIYSEKATKFCEIFTLLLNGTT